LDKSKLPNRHVTVGPERAPHRLFLYAMGPSARDIAQPLVGVVSIWSEAAPEKCSTHDNGLEVPATMEWE
jgi:dihydroxy-acid dehydratase